MRNLLFLLIVMSSGHLAAADTDSPTYETHIRPIFREHCFDCHGATEELNGDLDLRLVRLMKEGGESGPAIVPGKPGESYLLERILAGDMPPGEKTVSAGGIETIRRWIAGGAHTARPEPEHLAPGLGVTPEERDFWSFQPIRRPTVPPQSAFPREARVRTPIDALVLLESTRLPAASKENGRTENLLHRFAPDAERRTLVMRSHFDLIGLPPSPDDMRSWLTHPGDDWFDQLIAKLLDSPHYGERWARHWLDVAGYADSEGYTVADVERPWAWKYRDWVIRALAEDKPFDQFITEQLAGDELAGPPNGDLTPGQIDLFTATGFLRMAADGTGSGANNAEGRNQVVADTLKIVGTSLLGMSLQCAQCHDHRYDPIPQTDYYALRAVFEPALDWQAWKVPNARRVSLYTAADRQKAAEIEAEAQNITEERAKKQAEYMQRALEKELEKYDDPLRAELREAYQSPADKRSAEQKQLLATYPSVNISPGVLYQYLPDAANDLKKYDQRIEEVRGRKPVEEFLRALVEPANHVPATKLFHRGDHQQPKQTVAPAALVATAPEGRLHEFPLNDESLPTTGRRLAFARWLTSRDDPLLARVIVNRVWMHHFGSGLVATPADFGKLGARPSNLQLLDWLADEFMAQGWSLKKLHRLIMTSTVWRQSSGTPRRDPDASHPQQVSELEEAPGSRSGSVFLGKKIMRLEAETLRDRMLAASGQLDRKLFGPPLKVKEDDTGQVVVDGVQTRRSLYVQVRRSRPVAMLQSFDAPVMETNCESRSNSTVATQSLMLLNGSFILDQASKLADRAANEAIPFTNEQLAALPEIPQPRAHDWQYGFGSFDEQRSRTGAFARLSHWTGSQWQGGASLPDPALGWVLLSADGGHPDVSIRSVIRRWTAPSNETISISGTLSHPSTSGDGVRGRIVSSRSGMAGEWIAHHGSAGTPVSSMTVKTGDTIDFITDCRANHSSDSFSWPVTVTQEITGEPDRTNASTDQFRGPAEPVEAIPGRIVRAWQLAYCREPSPDELVLAVRFVARQMETLQSLPKAIPAGRTAVQQAMTNLCQSLLSSNEFLYVE